MADKIYIGVHTITEKNLRDRIIDKIPKKQFHELVKKIEKDLDKELKLKGVKHGNTN